MACKNPECAGCSTTRILSGADLTTADLKNSLEFFTSLIVQAYKIPMPDFENLDPNRMVMELAGFTLALSMLDTPAFQTSHANELRGYVHECVLYLRSSPLIKEAMQKLGMVGGLNGETVH